MTCIVALKTLENSLVLAGDFMASNGFSFRRVVTPKVFLKSEICAVGYTSSFRMGQILEHLWTLPVRIEGLTDDEYIFVYVVQSLREAFKQHGYGIKSGLEEIGGNFILVYKDRIFEIQSNFSILEYDTDMIAVGSGTDAAYAAMFIMGQPSNDEVEPYLQQVFAAANFVTHSVSTEFAYVLIDGKQPANTQPTPSSSPYYDEEELEEDEFEEDELEEDELEEDELEETQRVAPSLFTVRVNRTNLVWLDEVAEEACGGKPLQGDIVEIRSTLANICIRKVFKEGSWKVLKSRKPIYTTEGL